MLPEPLKANVVLLVGLPYWPGKHPKTSLIQKLHNELKDNTWLKKTVLNIFYLFIHPRRWFRMWRAWKKSELPVGGEGTSIMLVRNQEDHFMHPEEIENLANINNWNLTIFDGDHDDIWRNPDIYVNAISNIKLKGNT